jgi:hypothetical protein
MNQDRSPDDDFPTLRPSFQHGQMLFLWNGNAGSPDEDGYPQMGVNPDHQG